MRRTAHLVDAPPFRPEGAGHNSPGQSAAPPWVEMHFTSRVALKGQRTELPDGGGTGGTPRATLGASGVGNGESALHYESSRLALHASTALATPLPMVPMVAACHTNRIHHSAGGSRWSTPATRRRSHRRLGTPQPSTTSTLDAQRTFIEVAHRISSFHQWHLALVSRSG